MLSDTAGHIIASKPTPVLGFFFSPWHINGWLDSSQSGKSSGAVWTGRWPCALIPYPIFPWGVGGGGGGGGQASNNVAPSAPGVVVVAVQGKQLLLYTSQPPTYLLVSLTCNRACSRSRALFLLPYAIVPLQTVMSSSIVSSVLQGLWLFAISRACCKFFVLIWNRTDAWKHVWNRRRCVHARSSAVFVCRCFVLLSNQTSSIEHTSPQD